MLMAGMDWPVWTARPASRTASASSVSSSGDGGGNGISP
ncbi:MAG: hypothetical protein QOI75_1058, partial [Pseudonocardiales bacterium]|nr:hypothetical protein [Pseudonocardiales bacterium]